MRELLTHKNLHDCPSCRCGQNYITLPPKPPEGMGYCDGCMKIRKMEDLDHDAAFSWCRDGCSQKEE